MLETAAILARLPVDGIKLHQVMVVRGTTLEKQYRMGDFPAFSLEEYADLAAAFVKLLRPNQVIHRLMADSPSKEAILAPRWSCEKTSAYIYIRERVNSSLQTH